MITKIALIIIAAILAACNAIGTPGAANAPQSTQPGIWAESAPIRETIPTEPAGTSPAETAPDVETADPLLREMELEAVRLVNAEREKAGLAPLAIDNICYDLVKLRAEECLQVWSHTRPNGKKWASVYERPGCLEGIRKVGENLGRKFKTAQQITEALMKSDSHRNTILDPDYTHICIAVIAMGETDSGTPIYAIAQHFYQKEDEI